MKRKRISTQKDLNHKQRLGGGGKRRKGGAILCARCENGFGKSRLLKGEKRRGTKTAFHRVLVPTDWGKKERKRRASSEDDFLSG